MSPSRVTIVRSRVVVGLLPLLLGAADLQSQTGRIPEGFTPLFNGRDLTGWQPSRTTHQGITPDASVEDGVLVLRQRPFGQGGVLLTDSVYGDFELYLEAMPDWGTNGGIFFRASESASAYQVELAGGNGATGDLIGEMLRVSSPARADGIEWVWREDDWNAFRLRVVGEVPRVALWVNDELMYDVRLERNDLIADATAGKIGLQVHWSATFTPGRAGAGMERTMHHMWKPGAAQRFRNVAIRRIHSERIGKREFEERGKREEGREEQREGGRGSEFGTGVSLPEGIPVGAVMEASETEGTTFTNVLGMEFVRIEPGTMVVGRFEPACPPPPGAGESPGAGLPTGRGWDPRAYWTPDDHARCAALVERESSPGFHVALERAYYIGRYEVTQAEWRAVMGTNPSVFQGATVDGDADRHPVENVTWDDVQAFLERLNQLDPGSVYRLPTEFEWEYAARAGARDDLTWEEIREQAWLQRADKGTTQPVGGKQPNAWGLYDMLGNVWEWVEDFYNEKTFPDPVPPRIGTERVLRGGGFLSDVKNTTPRARGAGPGNGFDVGFRVVREIVQP